MILVGLSSLFLQKKLQISPTQDPASVLPADHSEFDDVHVVTPTGRLLVEHLSFSVTLAAYSQMEHLNDLLLQKTSPIFWKSPAELFSSAGSSLVFVSILSKSLNLCVKVI